MEDGGEWIITANNIEEAKQKFLTFYKKYRNLTDYDMSLVEDRMQIFEIRNIENGVERIMACDFCGSPASKIYRTYVVCDGCFDKDAIDEEIAKANAIYEEIYESNMQK